MFPGEWEIFGVDRFIEDLTPPNLKPGLGLRPGGDRHDLEPFVVKFFSIISRLDRKMESPWN